MLLEYNTKCGFNDIVCSNPVESIALVLIQDVLNAEADKQEMVLLTNFVLAFQHQMKSLLEFAGSEEEAHNILQTAKYKMVDAGHRKFASKDFMLQLLKEAPIHPHFIL